MSYNAGMKGKNHERSPDKKGFSIALPIHLIDQIQVIADGETRSRNKQIEHFLDNAVKQWNAKNTKNISDENESTGNADLKSPSTTPPQVSLTGRTHGPSFFTSPCACPPPVPQKSASSAMMKSPRQSSPKTAEHSCEQHSPA